MVSSLRYNETIIVADGKRQLNNSIALSFLLVTIVYYYWLGDPLYHYFYGARAYLWKNNMASQIPAGYISVMIYYAIWVPYEHDGPAKSAYGLGAGAILSLWTAEPLARAMRVRMLKPLAAVLAASVPILVLLLRLFW